MKTNMEAASYHLRIFSPNYGQMYGQRETANCKPPFAVWGKMAKPRCQPRSQAPLVLGPRGDWGQVEENHGNEVALMFH